MILICIHSSEKMSKPKLCIKNIEEHVDLIINQNIYSNGEYCSDKLNNWGPAIKIIHIFQALVL